MRVLALQSNSVRGETGPSDERRTEEADSVRAAGGLYNPIDTRRNRFFFFSSRRRHTRFDCDWSSDVCSSDLKTWGAPIVKAPSGRRLHDGCAPRLRVSGEPTMILRRNVSEHRSTHRIQLAVDRKSVV